MKKNQFFTQKDIDNFRLYIQATTKEQKDKIYNQHLYRFIDFQIESVIKGMNQGRNNDLMNNYEDIKQNLHIHIINKTLPTIDETKINAIQNYIYQSIKNALINLLRYNNSNNKIKYDKSFDFDIMEEDNEPVDSFHFSHDMIITMINTRIDEKINQQVNANCVASVYLQLLKKYVIENDYNAEGFNDYCMTNMNIKKSQFLNLSHLHGFRTIAFKSRNKN